MPRSPLFLAGLAALLALAAHPVLAEDALNANDLPPGAVTAAAAYPPFEILARSDKAVNIEPFDKARTAPDGEVFNARIKLNGGGGPEFRSIRLSTKGPGTLCLYSNSSSKTDARILKVTDSAGTVLAEVSSPPDDETNAGLTVVALPGAGTYLVFSASGGINLYQVLVK